MIRHTVLLLSLLFLWVMAFRNRVIALCGLVVLTVLTQKGDVKNYVPGVPGANPWNLTLIVVFIAWLSNRAVEKRPWNVPLPVLFIVVSYFLMIVIAYVRAAMDIDSFPWYHGRRAGSTLFIEELFNPGKYVLVAIILADCCSTRPGVKAAILAIILLGIGYGLFVVKFMPWDALAGTGNMLKLRLRIDKQIGLHPNTMAKVLVVTFWSILACKHLWPRRWHQIAAYGAMGVLLLATALCFSRAGYLTLLGVGFVMALVRWRKILLFGPVVLLLICIFMPGVVERAMMGFGQITVEGEAENDWNQITAGRTGHLWPPVLEQIAISPLVGHGRRAILRTEARLEVERLTGQICPTTPHNGFLEVLVDMGLLGLISVMAVFVGMAWICYVMQRKSDPLLVAVGGVGLAHSSGNLFNALSGGILLPDQGMFGTICAFAICLRVWCATRHQTAASIRPVSYAVPLTMTSIRAPY